MHYNITLWKQICRILTRCILYFILFSAILLIYQNKITYPYCMIGIPVILTGYALIERYVYHFLLYFILHGAFLIPVFLIPFPETNYRYLYLACVLIEWFHAGYIWRHNNEKPYENAPFEIYLILILACIIAKAYHIPQLVNIISISGIFLLVLHFLQFYLEGVHITLVKAEHATSFPTRKMLITSTIFITFLIVVFLLLAFSIQGIDMDSYFLSVGQKIGNWILALIKWILYIGTIIHAFFARNRHIDSDKQRQDYLNALNQALSDSATPGLLAKIINILFTVFVYAIFIYMIYRFFSMICRLYLKRYATDSDFIVSLSGSNQNITDAKEETTLLTRIKKRLKLDNVMKIRQLYKYKIKHYKEYTHKSSHTATDTKEQIAILYEDDISELTSLYEKARYSNQEVTDEDVKKGETLL